jgi:hypothetical protein
VPEPVLREGIINMDGQDEQDKGNQRFEISNFKSQMQISDLKSQISNLKSGI